MRKEEGNKINNMKAGIFRQEGKEEEKGCW
jgi:hypothetical protein